MGEITWGVWNCSGLLPSSSPQIKMDFLNSHSDKKYDVLVLIETHHKELADISPLLQTYRKDCAVIQTEVTLSDLGIANMTTILR